MVFAYGDESMDETKQRVCAVAAVIGTEEDWKAIEEKWTERNQGIPFHAKDCDVNPDAGTMPIALTMRIKTYTATSQLCWPKVVCMELA
jgi:hypothetical protein